MRSLATLSCLVVASSALAEGDFQPKRFHLTVPLIEPGKPRAVIVSPAGEAYQRLARQVQSRITGNFGAKLPVVPPEKALPGAWREGKSFILLGKLGDSVAVDALYRQHYVLADATYPGKGGHVVRTVHDPYGTGASGVLLGGSDMASVGRAVERFLELLGEASSAGDTLALPHTIDVRGPAVAAPLTAEAADQLIAGLASANFRLVGSRASDNGLRYHQTGDPECARVAKAALYQLEKIVAKMDAIGDSRGVIYLPTIFDLIEECSVWTDEDRDRLSRFLYEFAKKAPYANAEVQASPYPAGNNWNIRTAWSAARYFQKYYGMDVAGLVGKVDQYFANQMTWKSREDCPGYGSMTVIDNLHYVLKKPHFDYFDSGIARKMADYGMTVTNNLGAVAGFGDISQFSSPGHFAGPMQILAWYYRDGRYQWMADKLGGVAPLGGEFLGNSFHVSGLEPVEPKDLLGVHVLPLEDWVYENRDDVLATGVEATDELLRAGEDPSREKCFDKISFRNGFEKDEQYLLLGGLSHGYHAHPDGNSLITFTDQGKMWLFDNGYFVPDTVEHNTVAVFRDGLFEPIPRLTSLEAQADFPSVGMTQTALTAYNGMDWRRNVIWAKEQYFVVLDELTAREAGDYGCQCLFRVIGEPETKLKGEREDVPNDWQLFRQGQARFALRTDGYPTLSFHKTTPPAGARRGVFENQNAQLKAGESLAFQNIFYCPTGEDDLPYEIVRVTSSAALVSGPEGVACVGAGKLQAEGLPRVEAALFHLTPQHFALAGARKLAWQEPLFECDDAGVEVYLDLAAGRGQITTERAATVKLPAACKRGLKLDGQPHAANEANGLIALELKPGKHELTFTRAAPASTRAQSLRSAFDQFRREKTERLAKRQVQTAQQVDSVFHYESIREETVEVFVGEDGETELPNLARTGRASCWTEGSAGCGPSRATDENLESYSAVGSKAPHAAALPKDLGVEWTEPVTVAQAWFWHYSLQYVPAEGGHDIQQWDGEKWVSLDDEVEKLDDGATWVHTFKPVTTTRLRLLVTGFSESRTAIREMRLFGRPATRKNIVKGYPDPTHALTTADLNGDGRDEIIACLGNEVRVLDATAKTKPVLWTAPLGTEHGKCLDVFDLDADGKPEIVGGGSDHKVHCFSADGKAVWTADCPKDPFQPEIEPASGTVDVIAAGDLNQDGKGEVVFGASNWFAYALDHAGNLLWKALNWAHPPLDIILCDVTGDGNKEAFLATRYNTANLFSHEGKQIDSVSAGYHGIPMSVAAGDLDGNGKVELITGSRIGGVHCKEHGGDRAWSLNMGSQVTGVAVADVTGDDGLEVIACSHNNYVLCADAEGEVLWRRNVGGAATELFVRDVTGAGKPEVLVNVPQATPVLLDGNGEVLQRLPMVGAPGHLAIGDVDGDGKLEVVGGGNGHLGAVKM